MLVVNHRGREHLRRQAQELVRKGSRHDRRILDQIGYLVEGLLAGRRDAHPAAPPPRLGIEFAADAIVAFAALDDHEVLAQALAIVVEALHLDGPAGAAAGRQEAMPERDGARAHVLHERAGRRRGPQDVEWHDPAAIQEQHPANRTAAEQFAFAVVEQGVPAQVLGILQVAQRGRQHARQHIDGGLAAELAPMRQIHALGCVDAQQRRRLHPLLAREAEARAGQLPVGADRRRHGRTHDQFLEVGLPFGHACRPHHEAPRGAEGLDRGVDRHAFFGQTGLDARAELRGQPRQPARRKFLGADLDEQFSIHDVHLRAAAITRPPPWRGPRRRPRLRPRTRGTSGRPAAAPAGCRPCVRSRRCCHSNRAG